MLMHLFDDVSRTFKCCIIYVQTLFNWIEKICLLAQNPMYYVLYLQDLLYYVLYLQDLLLLLSYK